MKLPEIEQVIINNLKDQINVIANRSFPVDEFHRYAFAVLHEICHDRVGTHSHLPLESIQEIVFEETKAKVQVMGESLLNVLRTGMGQGRVTLLGNGKPFPIDLHPKDYSQE